jgi:dTDP-4-amino-4,6-dideoxygalactose transaminase
MLVKRKYIFDRYAKGLHAFPWAEIPIYETASCTSSYHVFMFRIKGIDENTRDTVISEIFSRNVTVNVHFLPLPMMTAYRNLGYDIANTPRTFDNYQREISLPVYYDLTDEQIDRVIKAVIESVELGFKK